MSAIDEDAFRIAQEFVAAHHRARVTRRRLLNSQNPIVRSYIAEWRNGSCDWEEAITQMVLHLVGQNEKFSAKRVIEAEQVIGKTRSYGIGADELHTIILDDLKLMAAHHGVDVTSVFEREAERPIWQTIRMFTWLFATAMSAKGEVMARGQFYS